jgi:hypothetical protein
MKVAVDQMIRALGKDEAMSIAARGSVIETEAALYISWQQHLAVFTL